MSKVFYDHLVDLEKVEKYIKKIAKTPEEREELYSLVDEILHHKMLGCVLDKLPSEHHEEFLTRFSEKPHDEGLLVFLGERIKEDVEEFIRREVRMLAGELLLFVEEETEPKVKKGK